MYLAFASATVLLTMYGAFLNLAPIEFASATGIYLASLVYRVSNRQLSVLSADARAGRYNRGGRPHTEIMTSKARFTKKFARPKNSDNCLFADLGGRGEFHAASLNVHERLGDIVLGENGFSRCEAFI